MRTLRLFLVLLALRTISWAAQDVLTYHNDNARTGQNLNETILNPSNVNVNTFGKLFILSADGNVDAQPLYVSNLTMGTGTHNVVFVATEHDSVYAYDADAGVLLWRVTMLKSGETPSDDRNCDQVTPEIGVTATPVIDRLSGPHGTIYLVAMSKDSSGNYHQRLHALDITTGAEEFNGPVDIRATYPGTGAEGNGTTLTFDPKQHKARASLLLLNNIVYVAWSSHCDIDPYTAWIMGYDKSTLVQTRLLNITPNGIEGSVWQSGAGLAADSGGNIYFLTANGTADTALNAQGFPSSGDYGNAFMKLSTGGSGLAVADYFNMFNTVSESNADEDLGSGGALVLPDMMDSNKVTWHLAVGAGKDQNIYLVNRDNMGQFSSNTNRIYQQVASALAGPEFGMAAYFNKAIYYGAVGDNLKMFPFLNAKLTGPSSQTLAAFNYPGTTPSVSANGTDNGIVWATENTDSAVLHAYDATNLATELYNSNQAANGHDHFGAGNKFITPMIANGKVYVGTTNGVGVFGLITATSGGGAPTGTTYVAAAISTPLNGGQALITGNEGPSVTMAYANLQADSLSTLSGIAIFAYSKNGTIVSETGVPATAPVTSGRIYVNVNGAVNTGVAFANPNPVGAIISFYFTDKGGTTQGQGSFLLDGYSQFAAFMNQGPFYAPNPTEGTFTFTSTGPIGAITLSGFTNERGDFLMSTLPVSSLAPTNNPPVDNLIVSRSSSLPASNPVVLPHFADGGGWTTQIILTNVYDTPVKGNLQFFGPGTTDQTSPVLSMSLNGVTNNTFSYTIQGGSSVRLVTGNSTPYVQVGSVQLTSSDGMTPAVSAVFSFNDKGVTVTAAGVSAAPTGTAFRMYAEISNSSTTSIQTGLALANPSARPVTVNVDVLGMNGISVLPTAVLTLPANGQLVRFIGELFPDLNAPFRGFLKFTASAPIGVTGLRTRYNQRNDFLIATTPARDDNQLVTPGSGLVFPDIVGGGGYTTQIIIYGGPPATGKLWFGSFDPTALSTTELGTR